MIIMLEFLVGVGESAGCVLVVVLYGQDPRPEASAQDGARDPDVGTVDVDR